MPDERPVDPDSLGCPGLASGHQTGILCLECDCRTQGTTCWNCGKSLTPNMVIYAPVPEEISNELQWAYLDAMGIPVPGW